MSSIIDIEAAVVKLSREDFAKFSTWFDEQRNSIWDEQMAEDSRNGKLRKLYDRLQSENRDDSSIPLSEFIDKQELS